MNKQKELNKIAKEIKAVRKEAKAVKKEHKASMELTTPMSTSMNYGMQFTPSKIQTEFKTYFQSIPGKNGSSRCVGADFLGLVATGSGSTGGSILTVSGTQGPILVSPLAPNFLGTRLFLEALRFEKYRFKKLQFLFLPDVGTNTNGSVILAYDPDPADNFINFNPTTAQTLTSIQTLMGFQDSSKSSVWTPFDLKCKTVKNDPQTFWYTNYTGGDIRLASQGALWVANGSSLPSDAQLGSIAIEYEIEFFDPSLDQLNSQAVLNQTAVGVDSNANFGFNCLTAPTTQFNGGGNALYTVGIDASGRKFINIPPGIHQLELQTSCNSGGTPTAAQYSFALVDNIVSSISGAVTTLQQLNSAASSLSIFMNRSKLIIPPGGSKLYGTLLNTFTGSNYNILLNLAQWASALVL